MSVLSRKVQEAINFAGEAHGEQKRKGTPIPYIVHPMAVALLLAYYGYEESVVVAGILHDVVEDTKVTRGDISREFFHPIAGWVEDVTEPDKSIPWDERKRKTTKKVSSMGYASLAIKTADAIANMRDMIVGYERDGDEFFTKFSKGKGDQIARYAALTSAILDRVQSGDVRRYLSDRQKDLYTELETTISQLLTCF